MKQQKGWSEVKDRNNRRREIRMQGVAELSERALSDSEQFRREAEKDSMPARVAHELELLFLRYCTETIAQYAEGN